MSKKVLDSDILLVAIIPTPKDLEIARLLGWYRIPLRFAPKLVDVDYLAFYQTSKFGRDQRWKIEYVAELRGHELCKRADLFKDEPDHERADEEYFRMQLGPLQKLDTPISAGKWKRITFFYSIGRLLNQANSINDLLVHSDERELIWKSLRERAAKGQQYKVDETMELPLELFMLFGDQIGDWNATHEPA